MRAAVILQHVNYGSHREYAFWDSGVSQRQDLPGDIACWDAAHLLSGLAYGSGLQVSVISLCVASRQPPRVVIVLAIPPQQQYLVPRPAIINGKRDQSTFLL